MIKELVKAVDNEKARCIAWVEYARDEGESDMRQVRNWINTDEWPADFEMD